MVNKIFIVFFLSSVKFFLAFPMAYKYQFNFPLTLIITITGGIAGVFFFAFLFDLLIAFYKWFVHEYLVKFKFIHKIAMNLRGWIKSLLPKKKNIIFSKKSRRYIRLKKSYGLWGIAVITPILLSIPLGTFLAVRFFGRTTKTMLFMICGVILWALILGIILHFTNLRYG